MWWGLPAGAVLALHSLSTRHHRIHAAIVFVYLAEAFDTVARELSIGLNKTSHDTEETKKHQKRDGMPRAACGPMTEWQRSYTGALSEADVPKDPCTILENLHPNTWFRMKARGEVICTRKDVRQGCKFGSQKRSGGLPRDHICG